MGTDGIEYRGYRPGDEHQIVQLYNRVFAQPMTPELWQWWYGDSPGRPTYSLAWSGDTLVAHTAAVPLEFRWRGDELHGARMQHGLVNPDFLRRGIFTEIIRNLAAHLAADGADFSLGLVNDTRHSYPGLVKAGMKHLWDIFPFVLRTDVLGIASDPAVTVQIEDPPRFRPGDVDCVAAHVPPGLVFNPRGLGYLRWRFAPGSGRRYVLARAQRDGEIAGWAVAKAYEPGASIDVVELFAPPERGVVAALLRGLEAQFPDTAVHRFSVWSMAHYPLHGVLTELGFEKDPFATHVLHIHLSDRSSAGGEDPASWYLAMGDSDVY